MNSDNGKKPKFIVDFMLGRLAKWLRILGYDTLYTNKAFPENILLTSLKENRIIVTRNAHLSYNRALKLVLVKSDKFMEQVAQLVKELKINISEKEFFSRCTFCNAELKVVENKEEVKLLVPEYVYKTNDKFTTCPECKRIYWAGSHYSLLLKPLKKSALLK